MKKSILATLFFLSLVLLTACVNNDKDDDHKKIELKIDLTNQTISYLTDDIIGDNLVVNKNDYTLELLLQSDIEKVDLYINDIKIEKELYTLESSKLVYTFNGNKFLNGNTFKDVLVTLDLGNGYIEKSFLSRFDSEEEITIKAKDDQFIESFGVFKKETEGLKFHQKLFVKYMKDLDVYIPVAFDQATSKVEDLKLPEYSNIIASHQFNQQFINNKELANLFNENILNKIIVFDKELDAAGDILMKVYNKNDLSFIKKGNEEVNLPVPMYENVIFKGWKDEGREFSKLPQITVDDNINFIELKADFENISLRELEQYLKGIIKVDLNSDLYLPKEYAGYELTWKSSNEAILTNEGRYIMPYVYEEISLVVEAKDLKNIKSEITFNLKPLAKKSLDIPIASSYIYRAYESTDEFFFNTLDIINTAFILADEKGDLSGTSYLANIKKYIVPEAKKTGSWVIMSVGPSSSWSTFSKSTAVLENFANNIVNVINEYGLDGVDIDWETPRVGEERQYVNLMKIVYEKVKANNPNHLVTTAITGGPYQPPRYDLANSNQYIDYINVMTYGMSGNGGSYQNALYSTMVFHNTALGVGRSGTRISIHDSVDIFNGYGVETEKLIMGVAFYGMKQIRSNNNGVWSSWSQSNSVDYLEIQNLVKNNDYEEHFDERTKVPYIIKKDGTEFYSYDNRRSILEKSSYVKNNKLGGIMFWEFAHDTTNELLKAIKDGLNK